MKNLLVVCALGAIACGNPSPANDPDLAQSASTDMAGAPLGVMAFTLVTGNAVENHYPGTDGRIGNADDLIAATPTAMNSSAHNSLKAYSYNAFDFGGAATEVGLPAGMNAITFVTGTVSADAAIASAGGGSIITGWSLSGTEPFLTHGAYTATINKVNSGTYTAASHALTMNVDLDITLTGGATKANGLALTGSAFLVLAADYGTKTNNAYVDDVLIPLAQAASAKALFFAEASGTVMGSTPPGAFGNMPIKAVLVGTAN